MSLSGCNWLIEYKLILNNLFAKFNIGNYLSFSLIILNKNEHHKTLFEKAIVQTSVPYLLFQNDTSHLAKNEYLYPFLKRKHIYPLSRFLMHIPLNQNLHYITLFQKGNADISSPYFLIIHVSDMPKYRQPLSIIKYLAYIIMCDVFDKAVLALTTQVSMKVDVLFMKIQIGYLKNHWTKHRLVCTHFDSFFMLIPNMVTKFNKSEIFENF